MTLTVIDVYMDNCAPCKVLSPIIDQLQNDNPEVIFTKINSHSSVGAQTCGKYGVRSVPTLIFVNESGERVSTDHVGMITKEALQTKINQILEVK